MAIYPAYNVLLDYLAAKVDPQEILDFTLPEEDQIRAQELVERNNAGTITPAERRELEQMADFDDRVALLKAKALAALKNR